MLASEGARAERREKIRAKQKGFRFYKRVKGVKRAIQESKDRVQAFKLKQVELHNRKADAFLVEFHKKNGVNGVHDAWGALTKEKGKWEADTAEAVKMVQQEAEEELFRKLRWTFKNHPDVFDSVDFLASDQGKRFLEWVQNPPPEPTRVFNCLPGLRIGSLVKFKASLA